MFLGERGGHKCKLQSTDLSKEGNGITQTPKKVDREPSHGLNRLQSRKKK